MRIFFLSLVFLLFSFLGILGSMREKRCLLLLSELERLLLYMKEGICIYKKELTRIYLEFESDVLDRCGFSEHLGQGGFFEGVESLGLDEESGAHLLEFARTLGCLCAEEQASAIERCIEKHRLILERKTREYPSKRRLYLGLGFMLGAIIFIIGI